MVEWMKSAIYNKKTGEFASPMDAYIAKVEKEHKELNLEGEGVRDKEKGTTNEETSMRPSLEMLQH